MSNKIIPINYTSRDFSSIKSDLVEHAKRYYETSFRDFSEAGFGSFMIDTVAYVGDILSFYLDYQANETFLETAVEFDNIIKIGKQLGYKYNNVATSTGIATFYVAVPATPSAIGPDTRYIPVLKAGSTFSTPNGTVFTLNEDVIFNSKNSQIRVIKQTSDGKPITYAIKSKGVVSSGENGYEIVNFGEFQKFKKIELGQRNIIEIVSVYDSEGNEYYEVENLAQNIIYKPLTNKDPVQSLMAKQVLKPFMVPRRFTLERQLDKTYLQFGASSDVNVTDIRNMIAEPASTILNVHGKNYISNTSFDPSRILNSDKLGIAPSSDKDLTVSYRYLKSNRGINFGTDSLKTVVEAIVEFKDEQNLNSAFMNSVRNSIQVNNEFPIVGDITVLNSEELKRRIENTFSSQNRAVTLEDYKSLAYGMPRNFGSIKRINVVRDDDSFKRNLNMYVLCENENGFLTSANQIVKNNLKTWISSRRMINDSIDILDGKVVNFGIEFIAVGIKNKLKHEVLTAALTQLKKDFSRLPDFGESFTINDIFVSLRKVQEILDVVSVKVVQKEGDKYSSTIFNIEKNMSADKRYINVPLNVVMELRYPDSDIKGTIL